MSETDGIVKPIEAELGRRRDMLIWRQNSGALADRFGRWVSFTDLPGLPDLMGELFRPELSRFAIPFGIECKTATGKMRKAQNAVRKRFTELHVPWIKARSYDDVVLGFASYGIEL